MKKMITLIKKEYWEQRVSFLLLPGMFVFVICVVFIARMIQIHINGLDELALANPAMGFINRFVGEGPAGFAALALLDREVILSRVLTTLEGLLLMYMWGILIFYFMLTLYQERKDRSILFWKSMPVSDWQTIVAKVLAGFGVLSLICFCALILLNLVFVLSTSIYGFLYGIDVWESIWKAAHLFERWLKLALFFVLACFWCLPIYAWMLMITAWVKNVPFAWVMGPPVLIAGFEILWFDSTEVIQLLVDHTIPVALIRSLQGTFPDMLEVVFNLEMLTGLIAGVCFIFIAVYLRSKAEEL